MREKSFGKNGNTYSNLKRIKENCSNYKHFNIAIWNRSEINDIIDNLRPSAIVHTAAKPSHDKTASIPFLDFEVNALGTLNLLEAKRSRGL